MRYRITFVAGLAVGYLLGAKAGKQRYEQIVRITRRVIDNPAVQETAGVVGAQLSNAGKVVYTKVNEKLPASSLRDFLDRPTPEEEAAVAAMEEREARTRPGLNGMSSTP